MNEWSLFIFRMRINGSMMDAESHGREPLVTCLNIEQHTHNAYVCMCIHDTYIHTYTILSLCVELDWMKKNGESGMGLGDNRGRDKLWLLQLKGGKEGPPFLSSQFIFSLYPLLLFFTLPNGPSLFCSNSHWLLFYFVILKFLNETM